MYYTYIGTQIAKKYANSVYKYLIKGGKYMAYYFIKNIFSLQYHQYIVYGYQCEKV